MFALDIGGTKIAAANVVNGVCVDRRQLPMPATAGEFVDAIAKLASGRPKASHAAVAVTGYTDGSVVRGVNRDTISYWDGYPLVERLIEQLQCPVTAINDAQAAAWGEYVLRSQQCRDLLFITLSTGVGGGLVLDGGLRTGRHGLAGHLGHVAIDIAPGDAPVRCGCGRVGCLETIASGTALARQASAAFGRSVDSSELFALAARGATQAEAILQRAAEAVASAIASSHMQLDLQQVVLGGSVGLARGMRERIEVALAELPALMRVPIDIARLGPDSGLIGAVAWALQSNQGCAS